MKRTILLVSALLIISVGFVFAAGQSSSRASGTEEVIFWTSHGPPDTDVLQSIVDDYNRTNPAVRVKFVQVPGSETDTAALMTAVRGGTGPDVYMLDRFIVAQRAADGVLMDITETLNRVDPNISSKYMPFAWAETQFRSKTYALPFDTDTRALFYNVDILRAAGVDPAPLNLSRGPLTIDQLREIARRVDQKDAQGNYNRVGFIPQYNQGWHYTWGFTYGGDFADMRAGQVTPTNPGVVAGFQFLYDWNREMGVREVQNFVSSYMPPNNPPQNDPFITGNLAMMVTGPWQISTMERYAPNVNYGITYIPVPRTGDRPSTWAGGWSMVIPTNPNRSAARLEGAVRFMNYIAGAEGQKKFFVERGNLPTIQALFNDQSLWRTNMAYFRESLGFARNRPALPVGALYWDSLSTAQDMVSQNVMTPQQALQQAFDATQPTLNRFLPLQ